MRLVFLVLLCSVGPTAAGQFLLQNSHTNAGLRGVHSVDERVAWASGTEGTVLRTLDGGEHWQHCSVPPGAEELDLRAIQAFDRKTAIVMSSGKGDLSRIYKTTDGCKSWKLLLTNPDKEGFFDAMQFEASPNGRTGERGWLLGDPVDRHFVLMATFDGGLHWQRVRQSGLAEAPEEGGAFAASNSLFLTGLPLYFATSHAWLYEGASNCTMGLVQEHPQSCLDLFDFSRRRLPMAHDNESSGIFSLARANDVTVAVGGDYRSPDRSEGTAAYSTDNIHWSAPISPPHGYRSAVAYDNKGNRWIAVGPNGTDVSRDNGRNWTALAPGPTEATGADKDWNALSLPFVVGPKGRIGRLHLGAGED
jgi:hypothetical protein